jgi:hypothetical protein
MAIWIMKSSSTKVIFCLVIAFVFPATGWVNVLLFANKPAIILAATVIMVFVGRIGAGKNPGDELHRVPQGRQKIA